MTVICDESDNESQLTHDEAVAVAKRLIIVQWSPEERDSMKPELFTCFNCSANRDCLSAFDRYNTDGDCLESK